MDKDVKSELLKAMTEVVEILNEPLRDEMLELSARLSAQRFLLEQLLANAFLENPEGFEDFMEAAPTLKPTRNAPMGEDEAFELQVRIETHVQRIRESVVRRLNEI